MLKPPARFLEMVAVRETSPSDIWDEDDIWENSHTKKTGNGFIWWRSLLGSLLYERDETWESSNRIGSTTNLNHHSTIGWTSFRSTKKSRLWSQGLYFVSRFHNHYTLYVHSGRISSLLYINQLVAWWWCFCCYTTCKYLHCKSLDFRQ